MRLLQQQPELADRIAFPFVVAPPLQAGARVTVALRAHRMVEHGTVVKHEAKKSEYLISFDRQGLGFAFYPDIDVASQWTCDLTLYDKARRSLVVKNGESHLFSGGKICVYSLKPKTPLYALSNNVNSSCQQQFLAADSQLAMQSKKLPHSDHFKSQKINRLDPESLQLASPVKIMKCCSSRSQSASPWWCLSGPSIQL